MNPLAPVLCASLPAAACAFAHYFPYVLTHYALLERAITRANLWHELAWDGEQAARDARRDVERGLAALGRLARE